MLKQSENPETSASKRTCGDVCASVYPECSVSNAVKSRFSSGKTERSSDLRKKLFFLLLCLITNYSLLITNCYSQWVQIGPPGGQVTSFAASGSNIFAGTGTGQSTGGVFLSTNNGNTWTETSLYNQYVDCLAISGSNIFAGTGSAWSSNGVYLSTNNGSTWSQTSLNNQEVFSLAISGPDIFAGTGNWIDGIYLSTNYGNSWTQTPLDNKYAYSLAISGANVFVGAQDGIYVSYNNGLSWAYGGIGDYVYSLAIDSSNIFAGTRFHGLYLSTDIGSTWTQLTSLGNQDVWSLATSGNNVLAGTWDYGVYLSTDNGNSWTQWSQGMGNLSVNSLFINGVYIYAGTQSVSTYRRPLADLIGIINISSNIPANFKLSQNYPNPFNPTTNIRFDIPKTANVKLVIYDILGREVATLVNEKLNAGTYQSDWDASNFASGVYFYRIHAGDFVQSRKMMVLK